MVIDSLKQKFFRVFLLAVFALPALSARAQCPLNIDFEQGNFNGWTCSTGYVTANGATNIVNVNGTNPVSNIHTLIPKSTQKDRYGNFSTSAPDGSAYSVKLGNDGTGSQAERISYTFTVPADEPNFSMTYQYAVVLEDPGHVASHQPRFSAKVFDIDANQYIVCSSFDYVATASLPGFKRSTVRTSVLYKDWTPVNINLTGYAGKKIRLEFTSADCTESGHFGYAYVDVNSGCTDVITGNEYCSSATSVTVSGPSGFDKYTWYSADRSKVLGTGNPLVLSTPPANGTKILLDIVPFEGFGCPNTLSTTIKRNEATLQVTNPPAVCAPATVDITSAASISPADGKAVFSYWKDAACTITIPDPKKIATSGTYYVKVEAGTGCQDIKPIQVLINEPPVLKITAPPTACVGSVTDITLAAITAGSTSGATYTYWTDANATTAITDPKAIAQAGTYYIKGTLPTGCSTIASVKVDYYPAFIFKVTDPAAICAPGGINLQSAAVTTGSSAGLQFSYFTDAAATKALAGPADVKISGTYYIKATSTGGCIDILPVKVTVNPLPVLKITDPAVVCLGQPVDITLNAITAGSSNVDKLTYWTDSGAKTAIADPKAITVPGTYYVKATSITGCEVTSPVKVVMNDPPVIKIADPATVCIGTLVDITVPAVTAGSTAGATYTYWTDANATIPLTTPKAIDKAGTYYIKGTLATGCNTTMPVKVSFYAAYTFVVNNPAAVCDPASVNLREAAVTAGSTGGLQFSYFSNALATVALSDPGNIRQTGTYYIKATSPGGCTEIRPVIVTVNPLPVLIVTTPPAACFPDKVDITTTAVTAGSSNIAKLTYWADAGAQIALSTPKAILASGTYYIKATSATGCEVIKPVTVTINPLPVLVTNDPAGVYAPNTIDITKSAVTQGSSANLTFTYFEDAAGLKPIAKPSAIERDGTYYITATNTNGCSITKAVKVFITQNGQIMVPTAFTPTKTQNNRLYAFTLGIKTFGSFKVYNRWGALVYHTDSTTPEKGWDGYYRGELQQMDTYTWYAEGKDYLGNPVRNSGNTLLIK